MTPRFSNIFHVLRLWMTHDDSKFEMNCMCDSAWFSKIRKGSLRTMQLSAQERTWQQKQGFAPVCPRVRIHVCSIWLHRAPHHRICMDLLILYENVWASTEISMRFNALHIVLFCRSKWFWNLLKGHLRARLKDVLWRWPWEKLPRPAAVHVKVCYGLFQLSWNMLKCLKRISDCCKTLQDSANGRAGMDFLKKIEKDSKSMNEYKCRTMPYPCAACDCFLSDDGTFFSWCLRCFLAPNNAATWYQMVPAYYSILQHTTAYYSILQHTIAYYSIL